jgi:hypothetical protein
MVFGTYVCDWDGDQRALAAVNESESLRFLQDFRP